MTSPQVKPLPESEFDRAEEAARFILSETPLRPMVGVVLGSGLGAFASELQRAMALAYVDIPHFCPTTVESHAGRMVVGLVGDVPVAVMAGRIHFYEGYSLKDVIFPMRVLGRIGIRAAILTNAAGGIDPKFKQGEFMVISDHMNLQGSNPLIGPNDERFGPRFPDMTEAYYKPYRQLALDEANRLGIPMSEGVYAAFSGPSYETPAEIRRLHAIGADAVGMSTVPEVIAARHMGIRVLGISCITNMAAGILGQPIDHDEVMKTGERVKTQITTLLKAILPRIAADVAK